MTQLALPITLIGVALALCSGLLSGCCSAHRPSLDEHVVRIEYFRDASTQEEGFRLYYSGKQLGTGTPSFVALMKNLEKVSRGGTLEVVAPLRLGSSASRSLPFDHLGIDAENLKRFDDIVRNKKLTLNVRHE